LGHVPADGRLALDQVHPDAMVGNIEGCLNACNACADYCYFSHCLSPYDTKRY
jgi:hypothetical protein